MTTALIIFTVTYAGVAAGRIPGLLIDRTGIALLGAIAMVVSGTVPLPRAVQSIDVPTILLLYALMIVSAQLRLGGFYTRVARRLAGLASHPRRFLLACMLVSAVLSAVLANDIVCLAFTPVLAYALLRAGLNPVPFLLGLAIASNIGSAATLIGNPQNMLIGQIGRLPFGPFLAWCAPVALFALAGGYLVLLASFRNRWALASTAEARTPDPCWPEFDAWQSAKGVAAAGLLVILFFTSIPRELSAIAVVGVLLCSRRMKSRRIVELVDWHLLTLFGALFVVIEGLSAAQVPERLVAGLAEHGVNLRQPMVLTGISAVASNLVSNVPAAMLLVRFLDVAQPEPWYVLAVSSTLAGNLITIGSIANLIVIEQARACGIEIGFLAHARVGLPVTVWSLLVLAVWIHV